MTLKCYAEGFFTEIHTVAEIRLCDNKNKKMRFSPQQAKIQTSATFQNSFSFNPLTDGIQIKAVLMGGGIECPPSKNLENEATESCEGSK